MDRGDDRDDWFGGAEPDDGRTSEADHDDEGTAEDWLQDLPASPSRGPSIDRRIVVAAVVAIALLIAVLAAAGVFSGSSKPKAPAVTTTQTTTSTAPPTTPAAATPAPTATLKPGDTGAQVKVLQRALASLGFSTGKVDGGYGPATQAAVEKFQTSVHLKADGIVGTKTLSALKRALGGS